MIAYEPANYDERRYRLRHGLDPDPEAPLGGEHTPLVHDDHRADGSVALVAARSTSLPSLSGMVT
jgi:hypothetical protein